MNENTPQDLAPKTFLGRCQEFLNRHLGGPLKDPKTRVRAILLIAIGLPVVGAASAGLVYFLMTKDLPKLISLEDYRPRVVTQVYALKGVVTKDDTEESDPDEDIDGIGDEYALIGEFFKERRYLIPYERIPQQVIHAFIAAEDDRFFDHQGISFMAILRASIANFKAGHVVQGGSTITQQVAKSLFLTSEKSFIRKFREAVLAYRMEDNLTKEEILFLYLNQIYLGRGAYGIQAASQVYFDKDVSELTLPEIALLAGLPQAPSKYNPLTNSQRAKDRQLYVLRRMYETRYISEDQYNEAVASPLVIYKLKDLNTKYAPYLVEHVRRYIAKNYGEGAVYEDGLKITLPSRVPLLVNARGALEKGLREVDHRRGYRGELRRVENEDELLDFLAQSQEALIESALAWHVLLPNAELSREEAMKIAGIEEGSNLIQENTLYEAAVVKVDDRKKEARVKIGTTELSLPMAEMEWAKPYTDNPSPHAPLPKFPSRVLQSGDIILVRVKTDPKRLQNLRKLKRRGKEVDLLDARVAVLEQHAEVQGAVFSIEPDTGYVLAMVGGYDFGKSEFNRALQAQRQPGSAFKPMIFSLAVEKGFTPASIIVDSPIIYKDEEFGNWKPSNFKERFYGDTTFRMALIKSRNIPTIKLVQALGVSPVIDYAKRLGLQGQFNDDLSISLGSASTSLVEMTKAYAVFPRQGRRIRPIFISKVVNRDGMVLEENLSQEVGSAIMASIPEVEAEEDEEGEGSDGEESGSGEVVSSAQAKTLTKNLVRHDVQIEGRREIKLPKYPPESDPDQLMDPRVAFVMTHLLKEVVTYGTGQRAKKLARQAAGKTGTTNDYKDAWFLGFTPNVVTGVWVGFDDYRAMGSGETGSRAALPIWNAFMKEAIRYYPEKEFAVPPGIIFAHIDMKNGRLVEESLPNAREEAFIAGTEPTERAISGTPSVESESEFFKEDFK